MRGAMALCAFGNKATRLVDGPRCEISVTSLAPRRNLSLSGVDFCCFYRPFTNDLALSSKRRYFGTVIPSGIAIQNLGEIAASRRPNAATWSSEDAHPLRGSSTESPQRPCLATGSAAFGMDFATGPFLARVFCFACPMPVVSEAFLSARGLAVSIFPIILTP